MSQKEKQAGRQGPEKIANAQEGVALAGQPSREINILQEAFEVVSPHLQPGERLVDGLERLLGELGGLRAMVGSDSTGRGLFVKLEKGEDYDKGGSYSLHLLDVKPGTVQMTAVRSLGRVVQGEKGGQLQDVTMGAWSQVRPEAERLVREAIAPWDLR